ncbi:Ribosomal protein S5 2-like protein [Glarea lozoyensis ATCC 20868]|uniref:Small ribosomal subunit protein uS5m n=1 Tax=Glarea lozoyensis (strain ATCC 20868 / MF5171) TaxID=1116229 RepID=S3CK44_GLAL2|nr:Ribosomal protein S5 2-like protein [Glarea lozoyensis ATCC 20868]EPE25594.1 Ribosomal protein S5 2-like protein [Glarea lozoyensis ATCC 20868]
MGLIEKQNREMKERARENFKPYTEKEKAALAAKYTPEQIAAIEAGEAAIDPVDMNEGGVIRSDWGTLDYLDDFSTMRTMVDRNYFNQDGPKDPNARMMTEQESMEANHDFLKKIYEENPLPEDYNPENEEHVAKLRPNRKDLLRSFDEVPSSMGTHGPIKEPSLMAPGIPIDIESELDQSEVVKKKVETQEEEDTRDPDGVYDRFRKQTGLTLDEILKLNCKILVQHNVTNQTRLGKIQSVYALAISGDGDGRLGIGEAKGQEPLDAMNNAKMQAMKSMQPIPRYEERTIFGDVEGKVSAVKVQLMSRPPGFGLRCQHLIFEMARAAGLQDLAARVPRSRNKMNTVKAAYQALMKQRIPDQIARGRGKKLVDVRKVYYGGRN